jgi:DMATS type aromatic prenyltransferase
MAYHPNSIMAAVRTENQAPIAVGKTGEGPNAPMHMPWRVLGQALWFPSRDQELWWLHTAPFFNSLLTQCGYQIHEQYHYLCVYYKHFLPVLGPFIRPGIEPDHLSCFTPEGYPFELSVNFQENRSLLRLGCGPVGAFAGTEHDPMNKFATRELLVKLAQLDPNINLVWFDYFDSQLSLPAEEARVASEQLIPHLRNTNEVAFDLKDRAMVPKSYFFVKPKSIVTGIPTGIQAFKAMEGLNAGFGTSLSLLKEHLLPYLDGRDTGSPATEVFLIGFDCVVPEMSRLKLYVCNTHLCLANLRSFWTLGGCLSDPTTMKGLAIAERLWSLLGFSDILYDEMDVDKLPLTFNYELKLGGSAPKPQLYLPVQGKSDDSVADALTEFFKYLDWHGLACRYKRELVSNL